MPEMNLYARIEQCLEARDADEKITLTRQLCAAWRGGELHRTALASIKTFSVPGRPEKPELVAPRELVRRSAHTREGHAALLHSICHIEFNAINLGLDAAYRFQEMPDRFYDDWLTVAEEEALHFELLREHLRELDYDYGDFPAHNGLWEMAQETAYDPLVRMALVPRVLEARGLDVTPGIVRKLQEIGDQRAVDILAIIHRDEIGHVEAGSRWFYYLCQQRGLDVKQTFQQLLTKHMKGGVRGPLDIEIRRKCGFSDEELRYLESAL